LNLAGSITVTLVLIGVALQYPKALLSLTLVILPLQWVAIDFGRFFLSPADYFVFACGIGWAIRLVLGRPSSVSSLARHFLLLPMLLAYVGSFVANSFVSIGFLRLLNGITLSLVICELIESEDDLRKAVVAFVISGFISSIYGLYRFSMDDLDDPTRMESFGNPNFTAFTVMGAAALAIPLCSKLGTFLRLLIPSLLAVYGIATQSQTGLLGFVASLVFYFIANKRRRTKALPILILATLLLGFTFKDQIIDLVTERNARVTITGRAGATSAEIRLLLLRHALAVFSENPAFGVGYGRSIASSNADPEIAILSNGQGLATHNLYAEVLIEGGIFAFLFFCLYLVKMISGVLKARKVNPVESPVIESAFIGLPFLLVSALAMNLIVLYDFWAMLGLVTAGTTIAIRRSQRESLIPLSATKPVLARPDLEQTQGYRGV
jgi:O-antigen ligase